MLFLPCAFAFLGNRDVEEEMGGEYADRSVIATVAGDGSLQASALEKHEQKLAAPLLRLSSLPLIRHFVRPESGSRPAAVPMQSTVSRVRQTELEALQAHAVAARAHAEALAAHARAAAAKAEAAAEEAAAAETRATAAGADNRRAA